MMATSAQVTFGGRLPPHPTHRVVSLHLGKYAVLEEEYVHDSTIGHT